jgi:hypothetical protein
MNFVKITGLAAVERGELSATVTESDFFLNTPAAKAMGLPKSFKFDIFVAAGARQFRITVSEHGEYKGGLNAKGSFCSAYPVKAMAHPLVGWPRATKRTKLRIVEIKAGTVTIDAVALNERVDAQKAPETGPTEPSTSVAPMPTPEQYISALNMRVNGKSVKAITSELGCDPLAIRTYLEEKIEAYVALSSLNRTIWRADELTRLRKEAKQG